MHFSFMQLFTSANATIKQDQRYFDSSQWLKIKGQKKISEKSKFEKKNVTKIHHQKSSPKFVT